MLIGDHVGLGSEGGVEVPAMGVSRHHLRVWATICPGCRMIHPWQQDKHHVLGTGDVGGYTIPQRDNNVDEGTGGKR